MLGKDKVIECSLRQINGCIASCSKAMIGIGEEMVPLSLILPGEVCLLYYRKNVDRKNGRLFFEKLADYPELDLLPFFTRLLCLRSLIFVHDLHFDNVSVIRNFHTGTMEILSQAGIIPD